jgi:ribosomal protein S12 methylthiotransferase
VTARRGGPGEHTAGLVSLGCPRNLVDAEGILGALGEAGWTLCADPADARVVLINTCCFVRDAEAESREAIRAACAAKRRGVYRKVVVTGCLARRRGDALREEFPEIDELVMPGDAARAVAACDGRPATAGDAPAPAGRLRLTPPHYAWIRIADGCNNRCSYCILPDIRGPYRSTPEEDVLAAARAVTASGAVELDLIAQDLTLYGQDRGRPGALPGLLHRLAGETSAAWIRLLYAHPAHVTDDLIAAMAAEPKVCAYLDLPLQHAVDAVLQRMGRKVTRRDIDNLLQRLRTAMPAIALRTTFIVGFPGETDADFEELLDFVRARRFERLGAFVYSREDGSEAAKFPDQVPPEVAAERFDRLMAAQQEIAFAAQRARVGATARVLIDGPSGDDDFPYAGRTESDAPEIDTLVFIRGRNLRPGAFHDVRITGARGYDLEATTVPRKK